MPSFNAYNLIKNIRNAAYSLFRTNGLDKKAISILGVAEGAGTALSLCNSAGEIVLDGTNLSRFSSTGDTDIVTSGAFVATFTFTNTTTVTFPTTGTLATLAGAETLTNKVLTSATVTTKISPTTNDGAPLGDTTHNFSDLFLASGAVLNYANGDVTLTHSSGILTLGTGELRITTVGTNAASVPTLGSTSALTNKTLTSPVISTGLTASGSAANTFAGSTGAFATSTGLNTFGGKAAFKVVATPVAATGSDVSGAAALGSANILTVSSDSAAKGWILPTIAAGDLIEIINTSSTAGILYPFTGGTLNGLSANAGVLIPASKGSLLFATAANTLIVFDMPAKATAA